MRQTRTVSKIPDLVSQGRRHASRRPDAFTHLNQELVLDNCDTLMQSSSHAFVFESRVSQFDAKAFSFKGSSLWESNT